jgi:hypothetical protein
LSIWLTFKIFVTEILSRTIKIKMSPHPCQKFQCGVRNTYIKSVLQLLSVQWQWLTIFRGRDCTSVFNCYKLLLILILRVWMIYYTVQTGIKFITWTSAIFVKTMCAKMWARKNKNRPVSGFFTKIINVQVMNFIPVKVSTLY